MVCYAERGYYFPFAQRHNLLVKSCDWRHWHGAVGTGTSYDPMPTNIFTHKTSFHNSGPLRRSALFVCVFLRQWATIAAFSTAVA